MESGVTKEVWQWKDNTQNCEILFIDLRNIFPDDTAHGADLNNPFQTSFLTSIVMMMLRELRYSW